MLSIVVNDLCAGIVARLFVAQQGPLVHDLGAMPSMSTDMSVERLESWLKTLPKNALRMMTISPHVEAQYDYKRLQCLLKWHVQETLCERI